MKVLIINGSPRREGNTHVALQEIVGTLSQQGIDSEVVWIGKKMHGVETTEAPEREPWTPTHFIR